jgi:hypothetical protein
MRGRLFRIWAETRSCHAQNVSAFATATRGSMLSIAHAAPATEMKSRMAHCCRRFANPRTSLPVPGTEAVVRRAVEQRVTNSRRREMICTWQIGLLYRSFARVTEPIAGMRQKPRGDWSEGRLRQRFRMRSPQFASARLNDETRRRTRPAMVALADAFECGHVGAAARGNAEFQSDPCCGR